MVSSTDDPTVAKVNTFIEIAIDYGHLGDYLVECFTWMKYIPSSVASWKRLAEERYEEYSGMFMGLFREVEDRIVKTFTLAFFRLAHQSCRNKGTNARVLLGH